MKHRSVFHTSSICGYSYLELYFSPLLSKDWLFCFEYCLRGTKVRVLIWHTAACHFISLCFLSPAINVLVFIVWCHLPTNLCVIILVNIYCSLCQFGAKQGTAVRNLSF